MKRLALALLIILPSLVTSCQCSNKPDIGPVHDEAMADVVPQRSVA